MAGRGGCVAREQTRMCQSVAGHWDALVAVHPTADDLGAVAGIPAVGSRDDPTPGVPTRAGHPQRDAEATGADAYLVSDALAAPGAAGKADPNAVAQAANGLPGQPHATEVPAHVADPQTRRGLAA
jgi:hypothetical protein